MLIKRRRNKNEYLEELVFTISLLAGVSAALLKLVEYSKENVFSPNISGLIELLGIILVVEVIILVVFLLVRGLSIWPVGEKSNPQLVSFASTLRTLMFLIPIWLLLYIIPWYSFLTITKDQGVPNYITQAVNVVFGITSIIVPLYFAGGFSRVNQKTSSKVLAMTLILLVTMFLSLPITIVLLSGTYSIDVAYFSDKAQSNTIFFTIKDTGIPSSRCWVTLSRVNESGENYFEQIEFVILKESKNTSIHGYISGKKKDGIY